MAVSLFPIRRPHLTAVALAACLALGAIAQVALIALVAVAQPVMAQEVTLRLKTGEFEVSGTFKSYDGTVYVVDSSAWGLLRLDAARFDCEGPACSRRDAEVPATPAPAPVPIASSPPQPPPERLTIAGSNTIGTGLMPALIRTYADRIGARLTQISGTEPGSVEFRFTDAQGADVASVALARKGSATAFPALASGAASIGMSDRRITDEEVAALASTVADIRSPRHEHFLGRDGLGIIVSPDNPIAPLSLDQIARIFAGQITDWSELGRLSGRINVYALNSSTGTSGEFHRLLLKPRGLGLAPGATLLGGNAELADRVALDPNGIGMAPFAFVRNARSLDLVSSCGLTHSPSPFNLKNDEYPLGRRLYLYTARPVEQVFAKGFLQFALSAEAQAGIAASQFVDQAIEAGPAQPARLAIAAAAPSAKADEDLVRRLAADSRGARRLSITLRFTPGSSRLDVKSNQDLILLARYLLSPALKGRTVLLMGHTDAVGTSTANAALSLGRANQVRTALLAVAGGKLDPRLIGARGHGAVSPIACNDTPEGHLLNRRVEVWLRD